MPDRRRRLPALTQTLRHLLDEARRIYDHNESILGRLKARSKRDRLTIGARGSQEAAAGRAGEGERGDQRTG